jgi:hypothetical protein
VWLLFPRGIKDNVTTAAQVPAVSSDIKNAVYEGSVLSQCHFDATTQRVDGPRRSPGLHVEASGPGRLK